MEKKFQYKLAGRDLHVSIGKVAEQASGACFMQYGDTVILVAATASKKPREGIDFFPLSVDYEEKLYSVGKFPGGFIKREGRPSEKAILTSRLIDRPLRPLFPNGYRNDVQVIATVLSVDQDYSPEIVAMIGSSISLSISDIPFDGPTGTVLVGLIDGKYIINPTLEERDKSEINLVVSGTKEAIMMVEASGNEVSEDVMLQGILVAHEEIKSICAFIEEIVAEVGVAKKEFDVFAPKAEVKESVEAFAKEKLTNAIKTFEKQERDINIDQVVEETLEHFSEEYEDNIKDIKYVLDSIIKSEVRRLIIDEDLRPDNRKSDEIRTITSEAGLLPRTHGSGLFTRGQTQVLSIVTLGASGDAQTVDGLSEEESKRFMHQYNFPPYSVGDTRPMRGPSRRDIGHGALGEKALVPVIPSEEDFPYTIRVVSEVLSSNGSSSQASICASTLAMLDAGVPLKASVAGIAMGLIKIDDKIAVLSDIQGMEDALGDMDFKVAGTNKGITAMQMDIKISGIDKEVLEEALEKARIGRLFILDKMTETLTDPRSELSPFAPRIFTMQINPDKIRDVIGPGGKIINKIIDETGVKIDIDDTGRIAIAAVDGAGGAKAMEMIENIVKDIEVGEIYLGKVTKIMNFGAFVEILNGKEGLVHISNIARERVNKVEDVLAVGEEVMVKVMEIDKQGRINLSRKVLLPEEPKAE